MSRPQGYVDLVGLVLYRDDVSDVYRIDNIYGYTLIDGTLTGQLRFRGIEYRAIIPMPRMIDALDDTYGAALIRRWRCNRAGTTRVYYQFAAGALPESVQLGTGWVIDAEL